MHQVSIKPQWTIARPGGAALAERTVALLVSVAEHGSLLRACQAMGVSYRHAWNLIEKWSSFFEAPLVDRKQGRGTSLTPFGGKLVWAGQRLQARLGPQPPRLSPRISLACWFATKARHP